MAKVMLIPAKREYTQKHAEEEAPKIRVAAYCRVSTDTDEQATSYEAQVTHYTEHINNNPSTCLFISICKLCCKCCGLPAVLDKIKL